MTKQELTDLLVECHTHLEYCGYGDRWERECAEEAGLPAKMEAFMKTQEPLVLAVGDKVHYIPDHSADPRFYEDGIIKEVIDAKEVPAMPHYVRVVYNCAGNWDDYANYTGALTRVENLRKGWKDGTD